AKPPYLVMEHVPGSTLREVIQNGPLSVEDAVTIAQQLLAALHHAHHHGLVHLDIRPENILVHAKAARKGYAGKGVIKLTDFGIGKAAVHELTGKGAQSCGDNCYMSPEQQQ